LQLFNKDQREGLAKVADNLATATIVATVVGGFIDNKIDILKGFTLITIATLFLIISYIFRKGDNDGD
jgi:undecaprenyl pyrophosphate phosphatase UppP